MTKMKIKTKSKVDSESTPINKTKPTKNVTTDIQSYIKELGLDQFTHETLEQEEKALRLKKNNKKSESNLQTEETEEIPKVKKTVSKETVKDVTSKARSIPSESKGKKLKKKDSTVNIPENNKVVERNGFQTKSTPPAKVPYGERQNKRISFSDVGTAIPAQATNIQPKNKRTTFDDTGTAIPAQPVTTEPRNKKIVFDKTYTSNSDANPSKGANDHWYKLLITPDLPWFQQGTDLQPSTQYVTGPELKKLEEEGSQHLEYDVVKFKKVREVGAEKSESRWLNTVLKSGTFADKIAAHTLLLQESVPHNLPSLRFLISLLDVKGRRECLTSLDALLKLMTEGKILNPSAKLVPFNKQPVASLYEVKERDKSKILALWSFEHQLKELYNGMLTALDGLLKDAVDTTRRKAISALGHLLAYSPEQEQGLLSRLVNKVGDPTRAVAASAVSQLERLLQQHGNMKLVVVSEMERLLYRPNVSTKAQYYGLCFLSQILLDAEDAQLANKLIIIYVSFFKACVKKGEVDSKLMAALLTGVKRAFPYTQSGLTSDNPLDSHIDTLFKILHMVRFGLAIQVLCILDQVVGTGRGNVDRFYSVLFRKLTDPDLTHSTKLSMFLNLVFQSLKRDDSVDRQRAFVKRILQVSLTCPPPLACGFLYLTSELLKLNPELKSFRQDPVGKFDDDDDEEEHYVDADDEIPVEKKDESSPQQQEEDENSQVDDNVTSTWIHRNNTQIRQSGKGYDPMSRNPMYARAELSGGFWELQLLAEHNHPSVALFAKTIMEGSAVEYSGDPLQDFTLIRFLDRFVFRNPKKVTATEAKGPAQRRVLGKRKTYLPTGTRSLAVDSKEFVTQPSAAIAPEEMFLYQYFKRRASTRGVTDDDDVESVGSEDFDHYLAESGNLDFASGVKAKSKEDKKKKSKPEEEEENESDEESDLDAAEDETSSEEDFDGDNEFEDAFKDFDDMLNEDTAAPDDEGQDQGDDEEGVAFNEEDVSFSDEGEGPELEEPVAGPSTKSKGKKSEKRAADDDDDLDLAFGGGSSIKKKRSRNMFSNSGSDFAAAEEFAALLEDNANPDLNIGGTSQALSNKDRASTKQLQWEMARDRWMKDLNRPHRGGKFKSQNKRRPQKGGPKRGGKR